ncbi:MAG TPA: 16S rRNA (cytidine(1402)-2'-O)-methyltransferase [Chitinophagales bacterium]|nr:16S rRNA (cytidine(1402)-2'-O)-methyltransferase [Chitinophagales bacterium]
MLFIVPTPIGNLEDITLRAINVLKEVDLILAEDTRHSGVLLKHFGIGTKMISYHQHNEHQITKSLVQRMKSGEKMALISDAGTPGISDAAFLLVRACIHESVPVTCLPGATAFVPALVVSGFPTDEFLFAGFLPQKKGRQTKLKQLASEPRTIVLYESPNRLLKLLEELKELFGTERRVSVSRELTKVFEETKRGTVSELISFYKQKEVKGEIVVIVEGNG